jgi:TolB-like protein
MLYYDVTNIGLFQKGDDMKRAHSISRMFSVAKVMVLAAAVSAQSPAAKKPHLAILPFTTLGIDEPSALTAQSLFRQELSKLDRYDLFAEKQVLDKTNNESCYETACGYAIGHSLNADEVLLCSLNRLGEKVIVQYLLLDVQKETILLNDNTTSNTIEDLETVMKRMALSVATIKPLEQTAQVGLITKKEAQEPRRRSARKYMGLSFGYLYPQQGYNNSDRSFAMDFRTGYEISQFSLGSQLAVQKGFAWNIYCSYLLARTDVCPYVGGAFGFHWVSHETYGRMYTDANGYPYYQEDTRKGDGFEVRAHSGLRLFRTYNFQILLNLDYAITLNDFDDRAVIFTIGLLR